MKQDPESPEKSRKNVNKKRGRHHNNQGIKGKGIWTNIWRFLWVPLLNRETKTTRHLLAHKLRFQRKIIFKKIKCVGGEQSTKKVVKVKESKEENKRGGETQATQTKTRESEPSLSSGHKKLKQRQQKSKEFSHLLSESHSRNSSSSLSF